MVGIGCFLHRLDTWSDAANRDRLDADTFRQFDAGVADPVWIVGDGLGDLLVTGGGFHGDAVRFVLHRQFAEAEVGAGNRIADVQLNWRIRTADFLPVLDRAGKNVTHLYGREVGDGIAGVDNDCNRVGPDDVVTEFDAALLPQGNLVRGGRSGRGRDVAVLGQQVPGAVGRAFELRVERDAGVFLRVRRDQRRGQFLAKRVRASDRQQLFIGLGRCAASEDYGEQKQTDCLHAHSPFAQVK